MAEGNIYREFIEDTKDFKFNTKELYTMEEVAKYINKLCVLTEYLVQLVALVCAQTDAADAELERQHTVDKLLFKCIMSHTFEHQGKTKEEADEMADKLEELASKLAKAQALDKMMGEVCNDGNLR